jgi:hypothetical protein
VDVSSVKKPLRKIIFKTRGNWVNKLDWLRVYLRLVDLGNRDIKVVDLTKAPVWTNEDRGVGEERVFTPSNFDRNVGVPLVTLPEETAIVVVNTTGRQGLAASMARMLEREGYLVVRVDNEPAPPGETVSQIQVSEAWWPKQDSWRRLKLITGIKQINQAENQSRAHATVRIGDDFEGF